MQKFLFRIFIFVLPIALYLLPPLIALKMSGEKYTNIDGMIEENGHFLMGYAYSENNINYLKWKTICSRPKQNVISLGSSRVLQFRDSMFQTSFYNAGFTISSIADFVPFLKSLPKKKHPQVLLIGLDQWMFNEQWDLLENKITDTSKWQNAFDKNASRQVINNVWSDLLKRKYSYSDLFKKDEDTMCRIGLNAIINNKGFRNDGSIYYGDDIKKLINNDTTLEDFNFNNTLNRIQKGKDRFEYSSVVFKKALNEVEELLFYCKANHIQLVAFLPPFADKVNEKIELNGNLSYMRKIYAEASPMFVKYGFELWDFTNLVKINSNDSEVIDGFHGGEATYQKMLIYMANHKSLIKDYVDPDKLEKDLLNEVNSYLVYRY